MEEKRKRVVVSIQQKLDIINKLDKGFSIKQLATEYNLGYNTIRDIRNKKNQLIAFSSASNFSNGMKKRKTMKKSSYEQLDSALFKWYTQQKALGNPVSGPICSVQAKILFNTLGLEGEFEASSGWLTRFKHRHGICETSIREENLDDDDRATNEFIEVFKEYIIKDNLNHDQIYIADESGLYWKCLPTGDFEFESERQKINRERLTIMWCSNASGKHKLELTIVGKAMKPQNVNDMNIEKLPAHYFSQKGGWMSKEIFEQWFSENFVPGVRKYLKEMNLPEKAILIIDNAPSHPDKELLKSEDGSIFSIHVPQNIATLIQPTYREVISTIKHNYRSNLLQKYIRHNGNVESFWSEFTILDAIHEISKAWENLKSDTLVNSWRKIMRIDEENENSASNDENINQWLECSINDQEFNTITDEEIIGKISNTRKKINVSDNSEVKNDKSTIHDKALQHVEKLLDYLDGQKDSKLCDIIMLRKLRSSIKRKCLLSKS